MITNDPLEAAPPPDNQEREYIVGLKKDVDYDQFWNDMETSTQNLAHVPDRSVDIVNNRPGSLRSCHYALSEEEARALRNDPRVATVSPPPDPRLRAHGAVQYGDFNRSSSLSQTSMNWGLNRCVAESISQANGSSYDYCLDGTGVDIVIQDSGVQSGHPEWQDSHGQTRLIEHDWYEVSGIPGTMPSGFYGDFGEHGTHVAGIAAGKLYGWAKGARIYSLKYNAIAEIFDVIKMWHLRKPVDPKTGVRRPTIVNQSWGYRWYYDNGGYGGSISAINYRGVNRGTTTSSNWGNVNSAHTLISTPDDIDQEELTDAGVICVRAAGNYYHKIDVDSGDDWNNHYTFTTDYAFGIIPAGDPIYYHRGGSPFSTDTILVANIDASSYSSGLEQLSSSSERGPGVMIAAPGTYITSATNNFSSYSTLYYPGSNTYKIARISGTSMAAPQVTGMLALFLQVNPHATVQQCKDWLINVASRSGQLYSSGLDNDYSNTRSLQGGPNRILYSPYAKDIGYKTNGNFVLRSK